MAEQQHNSLTEGEARDKWCPQARAVRGDGVSGFNRGSNLQPDVGCYCIASLCMAWRWDKPPTKHDSASDDDEGFCGLAGKL